MNDTQKIAAIVGITEAIKQYGIPSQFCPTIAIIVGAFIGYSENPNAEGILYGVMLGATTTGGYAVAKRGGRGIMAPFMGKKATAKSSYADLEADDYRGV